MNLQLEEKISTNTFKKDILEGLHFNPKKLSSKYFYDKTGDRLFQSIMEMPEYYLTKCELDIFKNKTADLAKLLLQDSEPFDLIELGAGDASKSSYLLKFLVKNNKDFTYMPIDISGNILDVLKEHLEQKIPDLNIECLEGEYFEMLNKATALSSRKKIVLFLGSNIGNMEMDEAQDFCIALRKNLSENDIVLMGFDLKKNPQIILDAYNDKEGLTAAFNLNLLTRINRELNADFRLDNFQHYQNYNPETGACRSYLISLCDQNVSIEGEMFTFKENEWIDMEISQKFSEDDIQHLIQAAGFSFIGEIKDSKNWFVDSVFQVQ
ncbi:L-histidine N(alpha)-methyltransferase [Chryseobacterium sp. MYb264]|uniref:L-histidine N(alpha)-methyltransferase n=1 Tax=Chryseobacterium sp. MYb264 TaxID=2745153 RepID=UPI002E10C62E|nr:L-histidine N(alpha)-methyltransferase [Chryseobacterium sp. MYb264]